MAEENVEDSDPILKSYDIYIKPGMSQEREIYVLQFPNRSYRLPYLSRLDSQPEKLRTKPKSGMVEMDVPVDTWNFYDRLKGVQWGEALKESISTKGKGSHGLPGGFGIGGTQPRGRGRGKTEEEENSNHLKTLGDFGGALERDQVLKKQTLGGQVVTKNESNPTYMIGTFRKSRSIIWTSQCRTLTVPRSVTFYTCGSYSSNAASIPPYRCDVRA
jgi:DNA-directed RNA polymerase-3 subunit RPC5